MSTLLLSHINNSVNKRFETLQHEPPRRCSPYFCRGRESSVRLSHDGIKFQAPDAVVGQKPCIVGRGLRLFILCAGVSLRWREDAAPKLASRQLVFFGDLRLLFRVVADSLGVLAELTRSCASLLGGDVETVTVSAALSLRAADISESSESAQSGRLCSN